MCVPISGPPAFGRRLIPYGDLEHRSFPKDERFPQSPTPQWGIHFGLPLFGAVIDRESRVSNFCKFLALLCLGTVCWLIPLTGCVGVQIVPSSLTALPASGYEVNLAWDAPGSSDHPVVGYNIYRSADGGGTYRELNLSLVTQTAYTDSNVQSGLEYLYLVQSVDASGVGSLPSNMAVVTIP